MAATTALSTAGTPGPVATDQHHHHPTPSEQQQQQTPQQRCTETEEHHRTGVTVTLPTIQVTEPRVSASDSVPLELLSLDLQHTTLEYSSAPVRSSSSTSLASGFSTTSLPLLEVGKPRLASTEVKLPPLLVPPVVPPSSLAEAVRLVRSSNMFLYLTLKHPPSHLHYNPYSFNVESSRPRGRSQYAILSSAGVTQVWPSEVTFTTMDDFQREFAAYKHLKKIRFFRNFRLSKTWQVWRRSVRCRKVREAKTRVSAYLLTLQPPFHATLVNVAALCHRLSHMGLLQVSSAEPAVMETWLARQQAALTNVRTRLASFRTLLLQVVASMMHTDDPPADADGSEVVSGEKRATSPRSNTGSSVTRRHAHASVIKMVRVVDLMVASALRTVLHNTATSLLDAITARTVTLHQSQQEDETEETCAMFLVKVGVEGGVVVCTPTREALMGGVREVVKACEATILSTQPLLPYFTPQDRLSYVPSEENLVLRTMLEDDPHFRSTVERVLALLEDSWKKVEAEVDPLGALLQQADTQTHEEGIQGQELSELGSWLAQVEGLVEAARGVEEVVGLGLLQVDQTAARKLLVTSLRQQQQRIHQDVSQGFDQRVRALLADANDKWLGLELAPVTAQQVVTLLNYVSEVKDQMVRVNHEEEVIREAYAMIQGYHITLHPEVHNKYEALQKEVKRLRKSVRRGLMERPTSIRKLKQLLDKEMEEVDAETAKLAEQVQALRFLRVTSDREEALKMLEAADARASTIRAQATTITTYQTTFQMPVCPFKDLVEVEEEISLKMLLWRSLSEWEELTERWYQSEVRTLDVGEVSRVTQEYRDKVDYLMGATQHSDVLLHLQALVSHLHEKLPVLEALTDSALRPRHWQEIDAALGQPLPPALTLAHVDHMALHQHAHTLQQVAHTAQLQRQMENRLKKVEESWEAATIPVVEYTRKDMYVLGDLVDLESLLLHTDLTLHLLLHSQHALHIKSETIKWKNIHTIIRQTLAALRELEEEWVALDPVLSSCTAQEVFPLQASVFASVSTFWHLTMTRVKEEPRVLQQLRGGMLQEEALQERTQLEGLRACLAPLLAMRRQTCPRLFLLPDADLLELLTKGQEPDVCHKYLRRLFTGIGRLVHGKDGKIVALVSPQEEVLTLAKTVVAHHGVEDWLGRVESGMRAALKRLILKHVQEDHLDLLQRSHLLPLQVVEVCRRIQWSGEVTGALEAGACRERKPDLQGVVWGLRQEVEALTTQARREARTTTLPPAQVAYLLVTLLDLRDTTTALVKDNPSSRWSYSWLQHLRHQVTGEGRSAGVQVAVGVDTLDYGYEYMGVASASVHTPTTLRARHSLLTAAIRHKCGAAVGGVGGGKTETLTSLARAAGHHLATLTCTSYTPAQSLQSVVSGCVQGGYWLLLEDAHRLTPSALSRVAQYLHNVHYTKAHALKRCVIDGQEMKLVDSFSVFMTVTQEHSHATTSPDHAPSPCSLLNHPVTPHITSVTVCPPTTETLLEAVLLGRGFAVSSDYLQKARECFTQLGFLLPGTAPPALSRLVQATARVCCDIRSAVRGPSGITTDVAILRPNRLGHSGTTNVTGAEITQLKPVPGGESKSGADGKNLKETITDTAKPSSATSVRLQLPRSSQQLTDQEIVTQALYAVLTPLLSSRELEWHRVFTNIFDIEETVDNEGSSEDSEIEESVREVLLEWGYGSQEYLESRDNLEPGKGLISDINVGYFNKAHADKGNGCYDQVEITDVEESNGPGEQKSGTDRERIAKLSSHGASLLKAALHMYSILAIHHCCCITAPSGAGKSTVWKVLAESLNRLWRKESRESPQSSWRVSWRVLQCGAFTRSHLLGSWHDDGRVWRRGVLFTTLTEAQQCAGERWVVLVGPFLPSLQAALAPLYQPSPVFKDDALHQVFLGPHVRIILELNHEEDLTPQVRARCPVLVLKSEAMGVEAAAGEAVRRLARSIPLLRRPQEAAEARSTLAQGLLNLHLPPTSLMCVGGCVCRLTEGRVTPTTPLLDVLEAMTQVLDLLHTSMYPHLHQDARDGAYTPARLDSRSPAPSDAFLDYGGRVVAVPEVQAGLSLLPQLLDAACPLLIYSKSGYGLSTFLDMFERNMAPATRVIRFRCSPLSTAEDLFSCMMSSLLPCPLDTHRPQDSPRVSEGNRWGGDRSPAHGEGVLQALAPGDEGFSLLLLEDVHLQLHVTGVVGTIWEAFRHMVECGEVVCPVSGRRYLLQRVVPLLALSCPATPDHHLPTTLLRHCVLMALPHPSSSTCEYIIKVCLQDVLVEIDEDNHLPEATRDVVLDLYQNLHAPAPLKVTTTHSPRQPPAANSHDDSDAACEKGTDECPGYGAVESRDITDGDPNIGEADDGNITGRVKTVATTVSPANNAETLTNNTDGLMNNRNGEIVDKDGTNAESSECCVLAPNLHHLLQMTEALRRNSCLLQLTMGQAASLITFEARRVFSGLFTSETILKRRISAIIRKYFEEVEEGLAWWPGVTEDGKKMMTHATDYNQLLKNVQYPEGLQPIMFTHAHFDGLLKMVLTLESSCGHIVITGPPGVGKMSLAKMAAFNTRARLYQLDDHREEAGRVAGIRAAVEASGVGGRRALILLRDHALTPTILDIIYSLATAGWSEGLWGPVRVRGLLEALRQKGKSPRPQENRWLTYLEEEELAALKHRLITNVRRNLHVCVITHSQQVSEEWVARYPSIRSRWTWVEMETWDTQTLQEVARRLLLPADLPPHVMNQLQVALPTIHQMLEQEAALSVTVADFVEACRVTVNLLARRRTELRDSLGLFKGGMDKLHETSGNVEELKGELSELEPELKATQEEGQRLTHALSQQRSQVSHIRDQMITHEEKVKEKCEAVAALNEEIVQEVGEAVPGLEAAEKAIRALDKKDLVEVRVLNKPPDLVLAVMEPICLLLNVKLEWSAMKTLLGDPTMTKKLLEIEKDTITDATLRKIKKYTETPKFIPEEVGKVSKPCRPLCAWLKALEHYAQVIRNVEPKKMRLTDLERDLSGIQLEQRQLQQQLGQNERELSELQARYEGCVCRRQQLEGSMKRATARLQRCTRLTTVLADEDTRWSAKIKVLVREVESVYGECAVGGVAVAYLACLPPPHRDRLLHHVLAALTTNGIITPKKYDLVETLSTAEARESWEAADLYCDPACFLQAAFVKAAARRPLVLDPDYMCVQWLTRMHEDTGGLAILQAGDDALLHKVLTAAHARRPILILHTPTFLTHNLRKVLEVPRWVQGSDGAKTEVVMVLVTGSAAPSLPPDLCIHVTRVSFALPPLVLEERLLNDVLKMEREDLYEQRAALTATIARDHKALTAVDDNILKKLTQASTALLDNEELLAAFYEAKSTSAEFRTRLAECRRTLQKIGNVRDKYRPVGTRARLLFSTSTALASLSASYVFSFQHFLHLFNACISGGDRTEALSFDQRIDSLVCSVTQMVVTHVSRALHPNHRLAFTTALCAAIAANEDVLKPPVWRAVLDPTTLDEVSLSVTRSVA